MVHMAMENGSFEDICPIVNCHASLQVVIYIYIYNTIYSNLREK